MAIDFYYGSGSPYAWRVWLALEHKKLAYQWHLMSFDKGDLKTPEYLRLNPRGRVPVLTEDGFPVYESAAIVEYIEQAHPDSGAPLFPREAKACAIARMLVREADQYLAHAMEQLVEQILFTAPAERSEAMIDKARDGFARELAHFEASKLGRGAPDAADFTVYPMIALALRMEKKKPDLGISSAIGPRLKSWMGRIEALPYFEKTVPPHWKAK